MFHMNEDIRVFYLFHYIHCVHSFTAGLSVVYQYMSVELYCDMATR